MAGPNSRFKIDIKLSYSFCQCLNSSDHALFWTPNYQIKEEYVRNSNIHKLDRTRDNLYTLK